MAFQRRAPGRPRMDAGDAVTITYPVRLTENILEELRRRGEKDGVKVATRIRRFVEQALNESSTGENSGAPVRIEGLICAGAGIEIAPLPDHITVRPDFHLPSDAYALLVVGSSMERPSGKGSIPSGSVAFFQPLPVAPAGTTVHVEWEENGMRYATVKRLIEQDNGKRALVPLNPDHKILIPRDASWTIKGVFLRALINDDHAQIQAESHRIKRKLDQNSQQPAARPAAPPVPKNQKRDAA